MSPSFLHRETRNQRWTDSTCVAHRVFSLFGVFQYRITAQAPQCCRQPDKQSALMKERELSALLTFSNLFCMCAAQTDTLCADPADECVCLVRWRNIHNHKAVSSQKALITFFLSYCLFPHSLIVQHPKSLCTHFYCGPWSPISSSEELLYSEPNNAEYTMLNLLMPPLGLACPCNFLS